jgi:homoserine trans-succinylase
MATEPDTSDSEGEYEEYSDDENEYSDYDDNALTSFRMFHQQLDNEEVEENPEEERQLEEEEAEEQIIKPTAATIASKLVAQGFTMEDMVNCLLIEHEEYEAESEKYERLSDRMFGKFRQIISNYPREQQEEQEIRVSSRLRAEDSFSTLQNRYRILQDDDEDEEV